MMPVGPGFPPWLQVERCPLAPSDSGMGHQYERLKCGLHHSMECRIMYLRKERRGEVLGFSPLSKCNVLWRQGLCGGATKSTRMRPMEGSSGSIDIFDGIQVP